MSTIARTPKIESMNRTNIRYGYLTHAALAQLHRWYLPYENSAVPLDHQLDILAADVTVSSGLGEARGHAAYRERFAQIPKHWRNAHLVRNADVHISPSGEIRLSAEVVYSNQGMLPDGAVRSAELTYTAELVREERDPLPKFSRIQIAQRSEGVADAFEDLYSRNRLLSLVHYWLALIEDPTRDPEPVRELLADDFVLNFTSGAITDFDGFKRWLAGPGSQVAVSSHRIVAFSHHRIADNADRLSMDFDWRGLLADGRTMTAKTRHIWEVVGHPTERFSRIRKMDVEVIEPFALESAP